MAFRWRPVFRMVTGLYFCLLLLFRRLGSWVRSCFRWIVFCRSTWMTGYSARSWLLNHRFFTHRIIILFFPYSFGFSVSPRFWSGFWSPLYIFSIVTVNNCQAELLVVVLSVWSRYVVFFKLAHISLICPYSPSFLAHLLRGFGWRNVL